MRRKPGQPQAPEVVGGCQQEGAVNPGSAQGHVGASGLPCLGEAGCQFAL